MKRQSLCPTRESLTKAAFGGDVDAGISFHIEQCPKCAAEINQIRSLVAMGNALPDGAPTNERIERVLSNVLSINRASSYPSRHRLRYAVAAAALTFVVIGALVYRLIPGINGDDSASTRPTPTRAIYRGTLHPFGNAAYRHISAQPDEIVRLTDGTLTVRVAPLQEAERFRVVVGDGEVEVVGTVFDISAENDTLASVRVVSGKVRVRPRGGPEALLHANESWSAPAERRKGSEIDRTAEPGLATSTEPSPESSRVVLRTKEPQPSESNADGARHPPGPAEQAFNAGWQAYKSGQFQEAVTHFRDAYHADRRSKFAEDAMFWECVILDRGGPSDKEAVQALQRFLATYPASRRAGEASAMLGWKRLKLGDTDRAKQLFETASKDASARVRKSAEQGLRAIERQAAP